MQEGEGSGPALEAGKAAALSRLLARRGAALGHMKQYSSAVADYNTAAAVMRAAGEEAKAQELDADAAKLRKASQQQGEKCNGSSTPGALGSEDAAAEANLAAAAIDPAGNLSEGDAIVLKEKNVEGAMAAVGLENDDVDD